MYCREESPGEGTPESDAKTTEILSLKFNFFEWFRGPPSEGQTPRKPWKWVHFPQFRKFAAGNICWLQDRHVLLSRFLRASNDTTATPDGCNTAADVGHLVVVAKRQKLTIPSWAYLIIDLKRVKLLLGSCAVNSTASQSISCSNSSQSFQIPVDLWGCLPFPGAWIASETIYWQIYWRYSQHQHIGITWDYHRPFHSPSKKVKTLVLETD